MGMIKSVEEIVREQLQAGIKAAAKKYKKAIRPIYGSDRNGRPVHIGTCFLIEYKSNKYLVTAAHVVDEAINTSLWLGADEKFIPIEGEFFCTDIQGKSRDDDHYDFAWMEMTNDFFISLGDVGIILESDISRNMVNPEKRVYAAMGFPCSKNKINPKETAVKPKFARYYSTRKEMAELYSKLKLTGNDHIAIDQTKHSRDENGEIVNSFHPRGMSGGPLIDLGRMVTPKELSRQEVFQGLLAGVLIEKNDSHKAILSVKINLVLNSIDEHSNKSLKDAP